jgi:LysM repeat protein
MLGFVILNILVSLAVVLVVVNVVNRGGESGGGAQQVVITVPVLITATVDPLATTPFVIVTATPRPGESAQIDIPPGVVDDPTAAAATVVQNLTAAVAPTIDPAILGAGGAELATTVTALPPNCVLYALKEGDFPSTIAFDNDVSLEDLLAVNNLTEEDARFLQIGQVLIVPLPGCPLLNARIAATAAFETAIALTPTATFTVTGTPPTPTITPSASPIPSETPAPTVTPSVSPVPTNTPTATATPTPTLPPTAVNSQMQIVQVANAGDVTAEYVAIRNNGQTVDLDGWTLRDLEGNTYTFTGQLLVFGNGEVRVYTGVGNDTPIVRYWGLDRAIWATGDTVILSDRNGNAQATFTAA